MIMSIETMIPIAVFLAMTLGAWALLGLAAGRPVSAEQRLSRLLDPQAAGLVAENQLKRQEQFQAKVTAAAGKLGRSLRPSNAQELGKIRIKLLNAGFRQEAAVAVYFGLKLIGLLIALAVAFPLCFLQFGIMQTTLIVTVVASAVAFYLPNLIVGKLRKRRSEAIFLGLPDALDLMVVCVEAGLGLDAAMRRVTTELSLNSPVICEEFSIANFQLQMGRSRRDVLRDLGTRTGVDDVRALGAVIIQADKFGSSIASALRVQSDAMRLRRRQLAEEQAAKTSVKIMLPLIFFIFPAVFVVLVGPAIMRIATVMSNQ
jgi:tight adherence protein C